MRDLFKLRLTNKLIREKCRMNMIIPEFNQVSYVKKILSRILQKNNYALEWKSQYL